MYALCFSVAYVSRSGGMSNELNNIIALNTDGVYEGVAIGGDRYISFMSADQGCTCVVSVSLSLSLSLSLLRLISLHLPCKTHGTHCKPLTMSLIKAESK